MNLFAYANNAPQMFVDPTGLVTTVYVWDGGGGPQSWAGHVSIDVNDTSFSWEGNGLNIDTASNYLEHNLDTTNGAGRGGEYFVLDLSERQEVDLIVRLLEIKERHERRRAENGDCGESEVFSSVEECGGYNLLTQNCGQVVMDALSDVTPIPSESDWARPAYVAEMLRASPWLLSSGRVEPGAIR